MSEEKRLPLDDNAFKHLREFLRLGKSRRLKPIKSSSPIKTLERIAVKSRLHGVAYIVSPSAVVAVELGDGVALGAAAITHEGHVVKGLEALDAVKGSGLLYIEADSS